MTMYEKRVVGVSVFKLLNFHHIRRFQELIYFIILQLQHCFELRSFEQFRYRSETNIRTAWSYRQFKFSGGTCVQSSNINWRRQYLHFLTKKVIHLILYFRWKTQKKRTVSSKKRFRIGTRIIMESFDNVVWWPVTSSETSNQTTGKIRCRIGALPT